MMYAVSRYTVLLGAFTSHVAAAEMCADLLDWWGTKRCAKMSNKGFCVPKEQCPSAKAFRCTKTTMYCKGTCGGSCDDAVVVDREIAEKDAIIAELQAGIASGGFCVPPPPPSPPSAPPPALPAPPGAPPAPPSAPLDRPCDTAYYLATADEAAEWYAPIEEEKGTHLASTTPRS